MQNFSATPVGPVSLEVAVLLNQTMQSGKQVARTAVLNSNVIQVSCSAFFARSPFCAYSC